MKTTVELPDALYEEARELAHERGWPVKIVLEDSLRRYLAAERTSGRKAPFKMRQVVFEAGQGLQDPGMTFQEMLEISQRPFPEFGLGSDDDE